MRSYTKIEKYEACLQGKLTTTLAPNDILPKDILTLYSFSSHASLTLNVKDNGLLLVGGMICRSSMDGPWQVPWSTQSFDQGNEEFDSVAYFFDSS